MKSTRLTNDMRNHILSTILMFKFDKKNTFIKEKKKQLGLDCYLALFSEENFELIQSLPEDWLPIQTYFKFAFGGRQSIFNLGKSMRVTEYLSGKSGPLLTLSATHKFSKRFDTITATEDNLKKERKELIEELKAVLWSVNTTRQLEELWPESKRWIPTIKENCHNLPAVIIDDLNKKIGI